MPLMDTQTSVISAVYDGLIRQQRDEIKTLKEALDAALAEEITLDAEIERQAEYIDLLENQVIAAMTEDDPIPFLPVDPEEKRRLDAKASDGRQCMIYRSNS